ncbi:MAG: cold shock domain-containing protein [Candidatus Heimdallarchaeaceae archaeon]
MKGTIKRVMYDRNFGFIQTEEKEKDIFFHQSGVKGDFGDLREGDDVEFDIETTDRGLQAVNLKTV